MNDAARLEKVAQLVDDQLITFQEARLMGASSLEGAHTGNPWKPITFNSSEQKFTIAEVNRRRAEAGCFGTQSVRLVTDSDDAWVSLEPIVEQGERVGETIGDPQVVFLDKQTHEIRLDPELTKRWYRSLEELEERSRKEYPNLPEWQRTTFLRGRSDVGEGKPYTSGERTKNV